MEEQYADTLMGMIAEKVVAAVVSIEQLQLGVALTHWRALAARPNDAATRASVPTASTSTRPTWARPAAARARSLQLEGASSTEVLRETMHNAVLTHRPAWLSKRSAISTHGDSFAHYIAARHGARLETLAEASELVATMRAFATWRWLLDPMPSGVRLVDASAHDPRILSDGKVMLGAEYSVLLVRIVRVPSADAGLMDVRVSIDSGRSLSTGLRPSSMTFVFGELLSSRATSASVHLYWRGIGGRAATPIGWATVPVASLEPDAGEIAGVWVVAPSPEALVRYQVEVVVERTSAALMKRT